MKSVESHCAICGKWRTVMALKEGNGTLISLLKIAFSNRYSLVGVYRSKKIYLGGVHIMKFLKI